MELKHTPGPWRAGSGTGGKGSVVSDQLATGALNGSEAVDYYGGNLIAESVAQENIPLIAAAPELLEALEACYAALDPYSAEGKMAREAIDKATGSAA
ncbi:MAG: hypothetical protein ACXVZJ_12090 [Terriglobales bacterium]